ncbi:MAG TPA: serine/threonine-protein kinase, partial [Polyangiaceae bacterium]|nr:serine/threonine-protein kinase [Polyangiaceae bacterium]
MDAAETAPVREGDLLAGKYRVERVIGVGGMGVVVAARHLHLDVRVALKFLLPSLKQDGEIVARFLREGQAAARIKSEHVGRIMDVGSFDDGSPYLVMEYLEGRDLAAELASRGRLSVAEAVAHVLQALEALAEAHQSGIVHRDLKPSNLFLTRRADGSALIKVLDFGISKAAFGEGGEAVLTRSQGIMGSPQYMSPEQIRSAKRVDQRSDIWSTGVILHELGDRLEASLRGLLQAARDDGVEGRRQAGLERARRARRIGDDRGQDAAHVVAAERRSAGHELVQDDAGGPDVRALVDALGAADLLRRHVLRRAHDAL